VSPTEKLKIFFATPAHRMSKEREEHLFKTTSGFVRELGLADTQLYMLKDMPWIDAARADLIAQFITGKADMLFFRDDDIDLTPDVLRRMIEKQSDVVIVPYKIRAPPHHWAVTRDDNGKVLYAGLGCTLITRETIERMYKVYGELWYMEQGSIRVGLFMHMLVMRGIQRIMLKEDHAFFERVRRAGLSIDEVEGPISHAGIV
jgi:hypothetical protein